MMPDQTDTNGRRIFLGSVVEFKDPYNGECSQGKVVATDAVSCLVRWDLDSFQTYVRSINLTLIDNKLKKIK